MKCPLSQAITFLAAVLVIVMNLLADMAVIFLRFRACGATAVTERTVYSVLTYSRAPPSALPL